MNYAHLTLSLTTWFTSILISALTSIAWAAPVSGGQVQACINAATLRLNGVPRSTISANSDGIEPDGVARVNWATEDGSVGTCWVDTSNRVIDFQIDVAVASRWTQSGRPLAATTAGSTVRVATGGGALNVRNGPNGEIVSSAAEGSTLTLTGQTEGEWVEIEGGGWVSQYLLEPDLLEPDLLEPTDVASSGSSTSTAVANPGEVIVAVEGGVNVRDRPEGEIVASLLQGATVNLTGNKEGEWVEIEGGGWVHGSYLKY